MPLTYPLPKPKKATILYGDRLLELAKPLVFGILNITPDSFYADSRSFTNSEVERRVEQLVSEGADVIDIGGYSSRPDAENISEEEEYSRLARALSLVKKLSPDIPISIDTFRSGVVHRLYEQFGAFFVNDISGGEIDSHLFDTVAELRLPYILMHIKGTPQTMQNNPVYTDVVAEVMAYFAKKVVQLRQLGINDIIIDPGFGFGKTLNHNYELLQHLEELQVLGLPVFVGLSRKSMLYKLLNTTPAGSLNATTVVNTICLLKGATILRVHDVKEANEAIKVVMKLQEFAK